MASDRVALAGEAVGIEALPCPWVRLDRQGVVVAANRRLGLLVQRAGEEIVGRPFDWLLTPAACVLYQAHLQPLLRLHGETAELGLTLRTADGQARDVLVYSTRAGGGEDGAVDLVLTPILRRREIEGELLRIKRAADQAPGMVFQLCRNAQGVLRFRYVNESVTTLYGTPVSAASVNADAVLDRLEPADREALLAALTDAVATRRAQVLVVRPRDAVDPMQAHEWQLEAALGTDGEPIWRGYVADVTERQRSQAAERRRIDAERLAQVRAEFLARASHELRTPLNAILGFGQILSARDAELDAAERRRTLDVMAHSGRHLLHLVDRLLDIASADRHAIDLALAPVRLAPVLDTCMRRAALAGEAAGLAIALRCPDDLCALADPIALAQVVDNFLSNAVKYNRPQGRVWIDVRPAADHRVVVEIGDSGHGLSVAQQSHLFEAFNRLGAEHSPVPGVGLGLVIARQLVLAMGGQLAVTSEVEVGTRITVTLQAAQAAPDGPGAGAGEGAGIDPVGVAPAEAPATPAAPAAPAAMARGDVLYVEDNEVNVLLMQAVLSERPGLDLRIATSLAEADRQLADRTPDLLLLDLNLPDGRADEWLCRRHADGEVPPSRIVLVTAAAGDPRCTTAEACGCDHVWTKPLDVRAVLRDVDRWLAPLALPPA